MTERACLLDLFRMTRLTVRVARPEIIRRQNAGRRGGMAVGARHSGVLHMQFMGEFHARCVGAGRSVDGRCQRCIAECSGKHQDDRGVPGQDQTKRSEMSIHVGFFQNRSSR
ncbi:MAG TPA: hypothetical protein DCX46_06995 [Bacteroidetes bacterium]|nr:hypothetical protein [Bacteroidota bacterium]